MAAIIDGRVVGEVRVQRLVLGASAVIHGDVTCQSLQIRRGAAVVGRMHVSPDAVIQSNYSPGSEIDEDTDSEDERQALAEVEEQARKARRRWNLLLLEPQVDFFSELEATDDISAQGRTHREVVESVVNFIDKYGTNISNIYVALDSHYVRSCY